MLAHIHSQAWTAYVCTISQMHSVSGHICMSQTCLSCHRRAEQHFPAHALPLQAAISQILPPPFMSYAQRPRICSSPAAETLALQATPWQLQAYTAALTSGLSAPKLASQMRLALPAAEMVTASILTAFPRLADFQEGVSWPNVFDCRSHVCLHSCCLLGRSGADVLVMCAQLVRSIIIVQLHQRSCLCLSEGRTLL